jgi:hypothetical protein
MAEQQDMNAEMPDAGNRKYASAMQVESTLSSTAETGI